MSLVASLDIVNAGGICAVDITALFHFCNSIPIVVGGEPHSVDVQPSTICVTPTLPSMTTKLGCSGTATTPTTTSTPCPDSEPTTTSTTPAAMSTPCTDSTGPVQQTSTSSTPSSTAPSTPNRAPEPYCAQPLLNVTTSLLDLNVDLTVYLNLGGLLSSVGDLVGNVVCGLLGCDGPLPTSVTDSYSVSCGKTMNCGGAPDVTPTTATAKDADDCVSQCRRAGIVATVQLGKLVDCLGASLDNGVQVDNCLFVIGEKHDILDLEVDALGKDLFIPH